MDIADITRRLLRPLGYLESNRSNGNLRVVFQRICCSIFCLFIAIPAFWSIIFEIEAFSEKTKAVMALICGATNFSLYIIMLWQRRHILGMFEKLQTIALARGEKPTLASIYNNANESYEKLVRLAGYSTFQFTFPPFIFSPMIQSYFEYYWLHNGDRSFQLAFNVSLPYNWRTPGAYFLTMIGQSFSFYYLATVYLTTFIMFFGICVYLVALFHDCDKTVKGMEQKIIEYSQCEGIRSIEALRRLRTNIHELIQFHCDILELVMECSSTYMVTTSGFFLNGALLCCTLLLQFHIGLEIGDHLLIVSAISVLIIWLPLFYMQCNFGEDVTATSGLLDATLFSTSWYLCPAETQRYFITVMMLAQRPLYMEGFARLNCTRETFKNVMNSGYSYFMLLRRFD